MKTSPLLIRHPSIGVTKHEFEAGDEFSVKSDDYLTPLSSREFRVFKSGHLVVYDSSNNIFTERRGGDTSEETLVVMNKDENYRVSVLENTELFCFSSTHKLNRTKQELEKGTYSFNNFLFVKSGLVKILNTEYIMGNVIYAETPTTFEVVEPSTVWIIGDDT